MAIIKKLLKQVQQSMENEGFISLIPTNPFFWVVQTDFLVGLSGALAISPKKRCRVSRSLRATATPEPTTPR